MRLTSRPTAAQLQEVLRFARQLHRDPELRSQLVGTRSLFGVAAVARRAGFALTPQALLRHQALWGSSWVGGYRRHLWRELLLPVDISALRLLDLQVRSRWRRGNRVQRLLWSGLVLLLVLASCLSDWF
jgi:hypothetical protein